MKKTADFLLIMLLPLLMGLTTLSDPTRPPGFTSQASPATSLPLKLMAIYIYPGYKIAIINDQVVTEGSHLGEFTITGISPYTVELIGAQNDKIVLQLALPIKQRKH